MHSLRQCIRRPLRLLTHSNNTLPLVHSRYASAKKNLKKNEELIRFQQLEKDHGRMLSLIGSRVNAVSAEFAEVCLLFLHVYHRTYYTHIKQLGDSSKDVSVAKQLKGIRPLKDAWTEWSHLRKVIIVIPSTLQALIHPFFTGLRRYRCSSG